MSPREFVKAKARNALCGWKSEMDDETHVVAPAEPNPWREVSGTDLCPPASIVTFQYGVDLLPKGNQEKESLGERSGLIQGAGVVGALVSRICHALAK